MEKKKRDERRFAKKLVRLAKYLEIKGLSASEVSSMLKNTNENQAFMTDRVKL